MSNNNSKIYLVTDADAKDEYLIDEVTNGITRKNLEPVFIITGQCSRKKRDISRKFVDDLKALLFSRICIKLSIFEPLLECDGWVGGNLFNVLLTNNEFITLCRNVRYPSPRFQKANTCKIYSSKYYFFQSSFRKYFCTKKMGQVNSKCLLLKSTLFQLE